MIVKKNRLIAENGMRLVSVDNLTAVEVWLSPSDSIANWREVTESEALAIEEEERRKAEEEAIRIEAEMEAQHNKGVAE